MEVLQYKEQVSSLQEKLDSVTKVEWKEEENVSFSACALHRCPFVFSPGV